VRRAAPLHHDAFGVFANILPGNIGLLQSSFLNILPVFCNTPAPGLRFLDAAATHLPQRRGPAEWGDFVAFVSHEEPAVVAQSFGFILLAACMAFFLLLFELYLVSLS
jgi:hypothetical protein